MIEPTQKQLELIEAALSGQYTFILFGGSVGGAKTVGLYLLFLIAQRIYPGLRAYFIRKDLSTITTNSYATWDEITGKYGTPASLKKDKRFDPKNPHLLFKNGARLVFFGENYDKDKELNRFKGLIPNWFLSDEINELQYKTYLKMYERAGRFVTPKGDQPRPLIVATCNPTRNWVKTEIYDKWKEGTLPKHMLYIPSKITDNPHLSEEYKNNLKNLPRYEYEVFVEGNWDINLQQGDEALKSFNLDKHVRKLTLSDTSIHISIDNNTYPYITTTIYQVEKGQRYNVKQVHEINAKDPFNTASKAGKLTAQWLKDIDYSDTVFVYGDPTTQSRNTIDDNKRSFYEIYVEQLKDWKIEKRMAKSNRSVSRMLSFVNDIFDDKVKDISIQIDEQCKHSINDYIETKQDVDGGILKKRTKDSETGISYEKNGHHVDTLKDFLCQAFSRQMKEHFSKKPRPRIII